jgi:hypothetical protein
MVTRQDPNVSKQSFIRDLDQENPLIPSDYGYNIAFGLLKLGGNPDPTYGQFTVNTVSFFYVNDG